MKRNSSMFDSSNSFVFEEKFTSVGDSSQNLSTTSSEDLETRQLEEEFNYVYKLRELEEEFKNNERTINEIQKETEKLKKEIELQEKEKDSVEEQLENEFESVKELKKQVEKLEQIEIADYAHDKLLEREIEKKIKEIEDEEEKVDSKIDDLKFEMENLQDKKQELQSRELEIRIKALEEGTNVIRIPEKVNEQKETDSKEKIIEKLLDKQEMLGRIKDMKETHHYVSNSEIILPVFQEISRLMLNINDYNKIENVNNLISKLSSSVTKLETFSQFYNKNVPELTNELFVVNDQVTTEFEIGNNIGNVREQTVVNNSNRTNLQIMEERKQLNQLETIQKQELRQMNQDLKKLSREKSKLKTQQYEMSLKKEESKMKRSKIQRKQQDLDRKELVIDKLRVKFKKIQKEIFILNQKEQSLKNQQKKLEEKQSELKREANNIKKDYQKKKNQF